MGAGGGTPAGTLWIVSTWGTGWRHWAGLEAVDCCPQEEYIREQIDWQEVTFADNQPCINLLSLKPYGILRILDDQCCFPQVCAEYAAWGTRHSEPASPLGPSPALHSALALSRGLRTPNLGF